jgi:small-conductance mechanosensitive channel
MVEFKVTLTIAIILVGLFISFIISRSLARLARRERVAFAHKKGVRKIFRLLILIIVLFSLAIVWGVDFKNLWLTIASVFALVAIGFVAVWSMLSNILASLIIFFSRPFKIGDDIKIIPEGIEGNVISIGSIFTTLEFKGKKISIPNNLIMQRIVLKIS